MGNLLLLLTYYLQCSVVVRIDPIRRDFVSRSPEFRCNASQMLDSILCPTFEPSDPLNSPMDLRPGIYTARESGVTPRCWVNQ